MPEPQWDLLDDSEAVARRACDLIGEAAEGAIAARGRFSLVLAGGSTPRRAYELLRDTQQQWQRWSFYFGDERCLPAGDRERNSHMAAQALLDHLPLAPEQVHAIPAELGGEAAAIAYADTIAPALPFDLVLLGMGEDGHTASIFPGHEIPEGRSVYAVSDAPKPPPQRVTLAPDTLGRCRLLLYLVTGNSKRAALAQWRRGDCHLPVACIPFRGEARVLADWAAGSPRCGPGGSRD